MNQQEKTALTFQIERKTYEAGKKVLASLGLDIETAVQLFLEEIIAERGLPFLSPIGKKDERAEEDQEKMDRL